MLVLRSVLVLFSAILLTACIKTPSFSFKPSSKQKPLVLLISIDGFKPAYLDRGLTPTLNRLAKQGVTSKGLIPAFPSVTFPNHYTLVTGLTPDHHGIVNNRMLDPDIPGQVFHYSHPKVMQNPEWWEAATPIWVTAKQHGKITSMMYWPGTQTAIHGIQPDDWLPYQHSMPSLQRTKQLVQWLERPSHERADFATLYFSEVDSMGHDYGPNSAELNNALVNVDQSIAFLMRKLHALGLTAVTSMVIVSDHGMSTVQDNHVINLKALVKGYPETEIVWADAFAGIQARPEHIEPILAKLNKQRHLSCWEKFRIPKRFKFGTNRRIPPIFCLAEQGWFLTEEDKSSPVLGMHGYDPALQDMHGLFIASGNRIQQQSAPIDHFDNVDVYPLLAELLGIRALPNDGDDHLLSLLQD